MANAFSSVVHANEDAQLLLRHDPAPTGNGELDGFLNQLEDQRVHFNQQLRDVRWWKAGDPATPLTAAYDGDPVLMRLIQGAQEEQHLFTMHGVRWLFQPASPNSGYVNAQQIGISEHMEFDVPMSVNNVPQTDYLYSASATDNRWDGMWGMLRTFGWLEQGGNKIVNVQTGLMQFPATVVKPPAIPHDTTPGNPCPAGTHFDNRMQFHVGAWLASEILGNGTGSLSYNDRFGISDPNAIVFVEQNPRFTGTGIYPPRAEILADLRRSYGPGKKPLEPLVLRVPAGSCVEVMMHNYLPQTIGDRWDENRSYADNVARASYNMVPPILEGLNFNQLESSSRVSLHPQLVAVSTFNHDGARVGFNDSSTIAPSAVADIEGETRQYLWYAGSRDLVDCVTENCAAMQLRGCIPAPSNGPGRRLYHCPVEFGAAALSDVADVIKHSSHGAAGMLIVEPVKSCASYPSDPDHPEGPVAGTLTASQRRAFARAGYCAATDTTLQKQYLRGHLTADVRTPGSAGPQLTTRFRDFAIVYQDDLSLQQHGLPMPNLRNGDDSEDSGQKAFSYRTEPLWARAGLASPAVSPEETLDVDFSNTLSSKAPNLGCRNAATGLPEPCGDPATPVFRATAGTEVRFRVVEPGGHPRQHGFTVFGHNWDFVPWTQNSTVIGSNGKHTFKVGSYSGMGPMRHLNVRTCAGGENALPGDYLYRTQESFMFQGGLWGIFRVLPSSTDAPPPPCAAADPFQP